MVFDSKINDETQSKELGTKDNPSGILRTPFCHDDGEPISKVIKDGKISDGSEYGQQIKVIDTMTRKGDQQLYIYQQVGRLWVTDKGATNRSGKPIEYVVSGEITIDGKQRKVFGYEKDGKDGEKFISLSLPLKQEQTT